MKCPVCGSEVDMYDICDNCEYQNNGPAESENDLLGPNKMTLREAREVYENSR